MILHGNTSGCIVKMVCTGLCAPPGFKHPLGGGGLGMCFLWMWEDY
jgi:hypothetical protein